MNNYTDKERIIIKQCNEGPYHTIVTKISVDEFNNLVLKLIKEDDSHILINLIAIYRDYNRNRIIDYFVDKGDIELLVGFLDYCNDFATESNELDQKYVIDKILSKKDKDFIERFLNSDSIYFLRDIKEKERLERYISDKY